jgi:hypothetical protein
MLWEFRKKKMTPTPLGIFVWGWIISPSDHSPYWIAHSMSILNIMRALKRPSSFFLIHSLQGWFWTLHDIIFSQPFLFFFFWVKDPFQYIEKKTNRSNVLGYKESLINQIRGTMGRVSSTLGKSDSDHIRPQLPKTNLDNRKMPLQSIKPYLF